MTKSDSLKNLVAALSKAQAEFPAVPRDRTVTVTSQRTGGKYTFAYAPLETIMASVRPVLKNNGLAFLQTVSGEALTTMLMHTSGEWIESDPLPIRAESQGSQALGSAITYARRYALTAMLGIVTEDDDDGNAADGNHVEARKPHGAERPGDGNGRATPTTDYWESMTLDMQNTMLDNARRVSSLLKRKDLKGAVAELHEAVGHFDGRENFMSAQWTCFESAERAALKANGFTFQTKQREAA